MEIKPITNTKELESYLSRIEKLLNENPLPGSKEAKEVLLLSILVEKYEKDRFIFEKPEPIEAILFRMEEQGLDRNDLIPFIGSKSKVSEVLSGKRPLSLNMVKSLSIGLGISADILLGNSCDNLAEEQSINLEDLPKNEMISRGWIKSNNASSLQNFIQPFLDLSPQVMFKKINKSDVKSGLLIAWLSRVLQLSLKKIPENTGLFRREYITKSFLKEVANLSFLNDGPLLASELLAKNGILLIIEKFLPGLKVDGASFLRSDGLPIIALSLRYDRLDSFWFTLIHELAHVFKHLSSENVVFCDNMDELDESDLFEKEANFLAKDTFVPLNIWKNSNVLKDRTEKSIIDLSQRLRIHPSIIAGRLQKETNNYKLFRPLLGEGVVRKMFGV